MSSLACLASAPSGMGIDLLYRLIFNLCWQNDLYPGRLTRQVGISVAQTDVCFKQLAPAWHFTRTCRFQAAFYSIVKWGLPSSFRPGSLRLGRLPKEAAFGRLFEAWSRGKERERERERERESESESESELHHTQRQHPMREQSIILII